MATFREDERGSSPVEFVLVGTLLTLLTLAVLQLGVAVYVRNVVHDAAVEGAYYGALADTSAIDGAARTQRLIQAAVAGLDAEVTARETTATGAPAIEVTVVATLPLIGLVGWPGALEVSAHAPAESLD